MKINQKRKKVHLQYRNTLLILLPFHKFFDDFSLLMSECKYKSFHGKRRPSDFRISIY